MPIQSRLACTPPGTKPT